MRIELENFQKAFAELPAEIKEAELDAERREEQSLTIAEGELKECNYFDLYALYLKTTGESGTGYTYTENLDSDPYALMRTALADASICRDAAAEPMRHEPVKKRFLASGGTEMDAFDDLSRFAQDLERSALAEADVAAASVAIRRTIFARRVINVYGMDVYAENSYYNVYLEVTAQDDPELEGSHTVCAERLEEISAAELVSGALRDALGEDHSAKLPEIQVASGRYNVVISSAVARNILTTAWRVFSGQSMLSGASPFPGTAGSVIGNERLNLVSAPCHERWGYYIPIDAEGTECRKKYIVEKGLLKTPLHNLKSAQLSGGEPTGNAGRGAGLSGITQIGMQILPGVFYIEPGQTSQTELLKSLGNGLHITMSTDEFHSVNIADGTFSIPCQAVVYKDGRAVGNTGMMTMVGTLKDLFMNIQDVGNDLAFTEFEYKNYCYGSPSLLVHDVIMGGAD